MPSSDALSAVPSGLSGTKIAALDAGLSYCLQADAGVMNAEHHRGRGGKWVLALVCVVLLGMGGFFLARSRLHRQDLMTIDSDGTMRLGPVSLQNTNVRNAALTVVGHLNNGTVSFSSTGAVTLSNFNGTFQAMHRAGITSVIIRGPNSAPEQKAK